MKNKLILGVSGALTMTSFIALSASCGSSSQTEKPKEDPSKDPSKDPSTTPSNPNVGGNGSVFDVDYNINDEFVPIANKNNSAVAGYYDQDSEKIKIGVTWSKGNNQFKILKALIEYYNAHVKSASDKEIQLDNIGSAYGEGGKKVDNFLTSHDATGSYNLIFNYSPNAAKLAEKGMLLNFRDKEEEFDLKKTYFDKNFTKVSDNVEHIQYPNGFWVVPGFKSTNTLSINQPVLAYILKNMVENGATVDKDFEELYNKILKAGSADEKGVEQIWGTTVSNVKDLVKGYVIKSTILTQYQQMLHFSEIAQKMFTNSSKANTGLHVMGIDDAAGVFNQSMYSHGLITDMNEDGLHKLGKDKGVTKVLFDNINKNDTTKRAAEEIFNSIKSALEANGLKLYGDGAYASNDQVYHKMAFSIGSSAGYSHNYNNAEKQINFQASLSAGDIELALTKNNVYKLNTSVSEEHQNKGVKTYISKYNNLIFSYSASVNENEVGGYDYKFASQEDEELFVKNQKLIDANRILLISDDNASKTAELEKVLRALEVNASNQVAYLGKVESIKTKGRFVYFIGFKGESTNDGDLKASEIGTLNLLDSKNKLLQVIETSGEKILSQSELLVMSTPLKWNDASSRSIVYTQGPSIIGIHGTTEDDKQTKKFVKWLLTSIDKFILDNTSDFSKSLKDFFAKEHTAVEYIQYVANYFIPTANFTELPDNQFGTNAALNVSLQMFKNAALNDDVFIFEEPGATLSDKFRSQIVSQFKTVQNKIEQGKSNEIDFVNDFVNQLNPEK
ncbi:P68 family surface lipoprotein [Mycoplasma anserisalpingitidis]|uniref:P80 family lipoprotein n=1 Tax=Mycoplasma anserisalpingitidis TaxID=519450 RepID=A0A5B8K4F3_9MOLU|nr:P80 family lipoprotein [Mycoplasma anserisalpingitidis]QDY88648.1 hypothetical protein FOY43_03225 [Mycoplasma anserisalpingitidis]